MNSKYLALLILLSFSFAALSYAQLGEQAGQPTMNVSVGSSATFNYSILNSGSTPINFTVILPTLNTIPHNATPNVTVTPMNGTLAPNSNRLISIKVDMPSSDKPGLKWQGIVQVVEAAPTKITSSGEGAVITAGVAKILTIYSAPPKPIPLIYYIAIVAAVIIIAVAASAAMLRRSSKARARMVARASRTASSVKSARKRTSRKPSAARKPRRKVAASAAGKGSARKKKASRAKGPAKKTKKTASKSRARKRAARSR